MSSSIPSARSGCCSPSWCVRLVRRTMHHMNWLWVNVVGGQPRKPDLQLFRQSFGIRKTRICYAMRCSRTCTALQLNPLEEAAAYQQLLEEFNCTQEVLSERIGRSRSQISNTIRLMKLPPLVQRRVAAGVLSAGHARALLGLSNNEVIEQLAQRIINEGLSVRATEEAVALSDDKPRKPAKKARETQRNERLDFLATSLADRLDTNVKIQLGRRKGKVSIEFASVDDLNRIMQVIDPTMNS